MITLRVEAPYGSFRKSFARSFAETYPLPPPATIYGMLLSLVGERFRQRHLGAQLAFAYKCRRKQGDCSDSERCLPRIATTLRKLSRFKYGVVNASKDTPKPDFVETLCGIEFLCWVNSSQEKLTAGLLPLESRIIEALNEPEKVDRSGVLYLGLSDDAVNEISLCRQQRGKWHRLLPNDTGAMELPIWADHVGSAKTRRQRYKFESVAAEITTLPGNSDWSWTEMRLPE